METCVGGIQERRGEKHSSSSSHAEHPLWRNSNSTFHLFQAPPPSNVPPRPRSEGVWHTQGGTSFSSPLGFNLRSLPLPVLLLQFWWWMCWWVILSRTNYSIRMFLNVWRGWVEFKRGSDIMIIVCNLTRFHFDYCLWWNNNEVGVNRRDAEWVNGRFIREGRWCTRWMII